MFCVDWFRGDADGAYPWPETDAAEEWLAGFGDGLAPAIAEQVALLRERLTAG